MKWIDWLSMSSCFVLSCVCEHMLLMPDDNDGDDDDDAADGDG